MTGFNVNPHRIDPYKSFKFHVMLEGKRVPNVTRVSALRWRTEAVLHRDGGFPSHLMTGPGVTSFDPIVLERGITHDTTFEDWAALAYNPAGDAARSLKNFRKDMIVRLLNEQGNVVLSYMVYRCWVSEYQALPDLDANGNAVAIETVVLTHEGFQRDTAVGEPVES